ncbi:Amino acid/polyamine transporter I [Cordyceps fumosorosea ARSEF 2679]|uniref:Amino acid/polyamine transporter I n=1 Tax=Cordyceps fumosorosea (strain ARSEF 2679) TaxID=1081104 RepID=A0A162IGP8_CORFA|nr:Amino acid/polyamine transporter I [Cordyceps fumosorosea ARSEF 2679]OAA56905.1 Amino acid/polyamine transporter I [Cordyceps fumosorosea ARSEF 2679]
MGTTTLSESRSRMGTAVAERRTELRRRTFEMIDDEEEDEELTAREELAKFGNENDRRDMARMGKIQEMRRNFKSLTVLGFCAILMCSWESLLSTASLALTNGGSAGLIYTWLIAWAGFNAVYASMAEMASVAPTTGGQYHWVSEFAPPGYQAFLSYVVGWLGVLGWQTLVTSIAFQAGTEIQGLLALNYDEYVPLRWHGTLLVIAVVAFALVFNTLLASRLNLVEGAILVVHVFGFFCVLVPLWVLAPRTPGRVVWTQFHDGGGWGNVGLSTLIGLITSVLPLLGADASVHMAEEVQDAARTLPRSMMWSINLNGLMGWLTAITFCYCIGDLDQVLQTRTGYPFIQVIFNVTQSYPATNFLTSIVLLMATFSCVTIMASASRQLFAFARDRGLPCSAWLARVHPKLGVPVNAVVLSAAISVLLSLINIGSTVAFSSLVSLGSGTLMISYIVCIGCFAWRRWCGGHVKGAPAIPAAPFSLGAWGLPVNAVAVSFLLLVFVVAFFPASPLPNLNAASMNWSSVILTVVVVWAMAYYFIWSRHVYEGPVKFVKRAAEDELDWGASQQSRTL